MKRAITTIIVISIVLLSGCGDRRIAALRSDFIKGCRSSGGSNDACSCTFDKIEEHYSIDQLLDMKLGELPNGFEEFEATSAMQCIRDN